MRHLKLIGTLVLVLVVGVALGYRFAQHDTATPSTEAATDSSAAGKRRILYWHDPMVPGQRFDKPGKSPFMDMQLVPVYADSEPGAADVRVNANVAQSLGIRLGKVERTVLRPSLTTVGNVAFDERRLHVVQARVEGYVSHLHVKAPFERVKQGQPLADIVAPQWLAAQEEYLSLLDARTERGQGIRDAARQRLIVLGVPEATIRAIERDRKTHATTTIVAPSEGVVVELAAREGTAFTMGAPLFRINGLETVWVNAQIPEAQVAMVPTGSTVTARSTAWPGVEVTGRVLDVLPDVDAETRTLPVRIELQNPNRKLAPGMFVSLDFKSPAGEPQLAVPSEAVIMTGERNVVIVAREEGGFDVAPVKIGPEMDGKTVILSGLAEGQAIVLSGQFLIDSEASLKSAAGRLAQPPADPPDVSGAEDRP